MNSAIINKNHAGTDTNGLLFAEVRNRLSKYKVRDSKKIGLIILSSVIPFPALLLLSFYLYDYSYTWCLLLAIPTAFFYVRNFAILHDCAHNSFFKNKTWNNVLGHFIGIFFYTPFEMWRTGHNLHHINSGNLDKRDTNPDVWLMTVNEYKQAPVRKKLAYRLFRNPLIYLTLVPIALFLVIFRLPSKHFTARINLNIVLLNLFIILAYLLAWQTIGLEKFILVQLPVCLLGFSTGAFMFYLQHQFEEGYFAYNTGFSFEKASLDGSSFYKFPALFNWATGSVGYHHIHHLNPGIPMYNLIKAHNDISTVYPVRALCFADGIRSFGLKLWDEDLQKMVPFS